MRLVATSPSAFRPSTETSGESTVAELFACHADGVFRLAILLLGRTEDAEDVVQETFLRLLRHVTAGRPLGSPRGWIYTVAAHACRDRQRARLRWLPWLPERDSRVSRDRADAHDDAAEVIAALRRLSPRDRLLIALRADGLTYAEIAAAAGLRITSIGRIVTRALERLTTTLNSSGASR